MGSLPANNGLQALNLLNPLAPPVYAGLMTPDGAVDFTYPYNVSLTANQALQDTTKTDTDADFQLTAIIINVYTSILFSFRLNINGIYYLSSSEVLAGNLVSDPSVPFPILGRFIIPRGADLNINITDLSGAGNTIQILYRGMKLYGSNGR